MNVVWVVGLTLLPVVAGGALGYGFGLRRLMVRLGPWILAGVAGVATTVAAFRLRQVEPFGLVTPIVWGGAAACLAAAGARRALGRAVLPAASAAGRVAGSLLGIGGGFMLAAVAWLAMGISQVAASAGSPPAQVKSPPPSWGEELFKTANRGFLRHLPAVGSVSDETEATIAVLRSDPSDRAALARQKGWDRLSDLPSLKGLLADPEFRADLQSVADGSVTALYRLQKNARVIAFYKEETIQRMVPELRPSAIARELEEIRRRADR